MAGNFHYIPEEQKKLILTMSLWGTSNHDIEIATGIKPGRLIRLVLKSGAHPYQKRLFVTNVYKASDSDSTAIRAMWRHLSNRQTLVRVTGWQP